MMKKITALSLLCFGLTFGSVAQNNQKKNNETQFGKRQQHQVCAKPKEYKVTRKKAVLKNDQALKKAGLKQDAPQIKRYPKAVHMKNVLIKAR